VRLSGKALEPYGAGGYGMNNRLRCTSDGYIIRRCRANSGLSRPWNVGPSAEVAPLQLCPPALITATGIWQAHLGAFGLAYGFSAIGLSRFRK
jgi:hypothetical protein